MMSSTVALESAPVTQVAIAICVLLLGVHTVWDSARNHTAHRVEWADRGLRVQRGVFGGFMIAGALAALVVKLLGL